VLARVWSLTSARDLIRLLGLGRNKGGKESWQEKEGEKRKKGRTSPNVVFICYRQIRVTGLGPSGSWLSHPRELSVFPDFVCLTACASVTFARFCARGCESRYPSVPLLVCSGHHIIRHLLLLPPSYPPNISCILAYFLGLISYRHRHLIPIHTLNASFFAFFSP